MISFTQTDLYLVLKPSLTELDIPAFLRRAATHKQLFSLDEQFLNNLKIMICDTKATSKQLDGLLIGKVCFDPHHSCIESSLAIFNKSILNPIFQTLQHIIHANDLLSEISVAAMSCLQQLIKIIYKTYDVKTHQVAITTLNALLQVIFKKLD